MTVPFVYSDLDFNFIPNPITGDVAIKYDADAVKASITSLVLTHNYERPFHSEIGSQVGNMLFELGSNLTTLSIQQSIIDVITTFEPRAQINFVTVDTDNDPHSITATINFTVVNTTQPVQMSLVLMRTR